MITNPTSTAIPASTTGDDNVNDDSAGTLMGADDGAVGIDAPPELALDDARSTAGWTSDGAGASVSANDAAGMTFVDGTGDVTGGGGGGGGLVAGVVVTCSPDGSVSVGAGFR